MRCYHKMLCISYKDYVTNEEVCAKIQQATRPHEDLLTIIKRRKPSCKAQWKGKEDKADRGRGGKTTSGNGQAWSSASPRGQWRTGENWGNWLWNHLWCPNDPHGEGMDEMRWEMHLFVALDMFWWEIVGIFLRGYLSALCDWRPWALRMRENLMLLLLRVDWCLRTGP